MSVHGSDVSGSREGHLQLHVEPVVLPGDAIVDVRVRLDFAPGVELYTGAAQPACAGGWLSPVWDLDFAPAGPRFRHLRTWYGPPGMPPHEDWFVGNLTTAASTIDLPSCWIPRRLAGELTSKVLDPEGMDALEPAWVDDASILVLGKSRADAGPLAELVRPGPVIFFPEPGRFAVHASYRQEKWSGFFKPIRELELKSAPVDLDVG